MSMSNGLRPPRIYSPPPPLGPQEDEHDVASPEPPDFDSNVPPIHPLTSHMRSISSPANSVSLLGDESGSVTPPRPTTPTHPPSTDSQRASKRSARSTPVTEESLFPEHPLPSPPRPLARATSDEESKVSQDRTIRIWIQSWNMGAKTPFRLIQEEDGSKKVDPSEVDKIAPVIPDGYDIYVFGLQESPDDSFFDLVSHYFTPLGIERVPLHPTRDRVNGRGDGSFLSTKYTGIGVYVASHCASQVTCKTSCGISTGIIQGSKGGAGVVLRVYGTTILFMSVHMSSNSERDKANDYRTIVDKGGGALGEKHFHLLEQFHHIVWFGDLNYRTSRLTADEALDYMARGNVKKVWQHDSLLYELSHKRAFFKFREPIPREDFYPTYKKKPARQFDFDDMPENLREKNIKRRRRRVATDVEEDGVAESAPAQGIVRSQTPKARDVPMKEYWDRHRRLTEVYRTKYKEPFYKGGAVGDRIPSFTDRVLIYSLDTEHGALLAERDMGPLNQSFVSKRCHNYGCIAHHLTTSDHSAIYAGLRLKCPVLRPRPQEEFDTQRNEFKRYSVIIRSVKLVKPDGRQEYPKSFRVCFPAPYEEENFKCQTKYVTRDELLQYKRLREETLYHSHSALSSSHGTYYSVQQDPLLLLPRKQPRRVKNGSRKERRNGGTSSSKSSRQLPQQTERPQPPSSSSQFQEEKETFSEPRHSSKTIALTADGANQTAALLSQKAEFEKKNPRYHASMPAANLRSSSTGGDDVFQKPKLPHQQSVEYLNLALTPRQSQKFLTIGVDLGLNLTQEAVAEDAAAETKERESSEADAPQIVGSDVLIKDNYFEARRTSERGRARSGSFSGVKTKLRQTEEEIEKQNQIFQDLHNAEQKLTLRCRGGPMRPARGFIHLVMKLYFADGNQGQTVFGFDWTDFSHQREAKLEMELTRQGLPLYDPETNEKFRAKVEFKLTLD